MQVSFADISYSFKPWTPAMGKVFRTSYAFDCETTLIDRDRPWITPAYVIGAAFDGRQGYFMTRDHVADFFGAHRTVPVAMHHASFDLSVIHALAPTLDIYGLVDRNRVWDTQLLHRLYALATNGNTARGKGESTLEHCARTYLGLELPKDVSDSQGNPIRLSYGQWLNRPPRDIEPVYLDYLAKDAIATRLIFDRLWSRLAALLNSSGDIWGYVSPEWLKDQIRKWGPLTHHIQLRASIVLERVTANGMQLDLERRGDLINTLKALASEKLVALREFGYLPGPGSQKALQAIFTRMERQHAEMPFPRTETGQYATSRDALQELAGTVPFINLFLDHKATEKLLGAFVNKMGKQVLHPSFDVLVRTGRTSSFGEINAQNLPTDDRVRSCFVPSSGHVFVDADYRTIELATLAQSCLSQFNLDSQMAHAINAGEDLHTLVAAAVTNKPADAITKAERAKAKPINFGKPGGMSERTLQRYAKVTYGVTLTDDEVAALSDAWFALFPEMEDFLTDNFDLGLGVAQLLKLTPTSHFEHTEDDRFLTHPQNAGRENEPHSILGFMCLKTLKQDKPCKRNGEPYTGADIDYFWTRLESQINLLPHQHQQSVRQRRPRSSLQCAVMNLVDRAGVFTLSGRLRSNASYCARHNTVFQGLAADGMKLAMWLLWRAGYRIVNEIHDQILIEVPVGSDLTAHANKIRQLMIDGMQAVVPDVKVDVSIAVADRWRKDAEAVYDHDQKLVVWQPAAAAGVAPPIIPSATATLPTSP